MTNDIRLGSNYVSRNYEKQFRDAIIEILNGRAPAHWDKVYRLGFEQDLKKGIINPSEIFYLYLAKYSNKLI